MAEPIDSFEALIDACVAAPTRGNAQAIRLAFDPFVNALLHHFSGHYLKHLDAAVADEEPKDPGSRQDDIITSATRLRQALALAETDGRNPVTAVARALAPDPEEA